MTASSLRTTDILTHTVVTFLTPMFFAATGDLEQARTAAIETVRACLTRNPMDLFLIGQMIALGLATLSSVSLSMAENIPINLILRLRGNAVSLHRASEQCRRALPEPAQQEAPFSDIDLAEEERIIAEVAETRKRVDEYRAGLAQPQAAPLRSAMPVQATTQDLPTSLGTMKAATARIAVEPERRIDEARPASNTTLRDISPSAEKIAHAAWLYAMPGVPFPGFDDSDSPPPVEPRTTGSMRAAALSTTANQLIGGAAPPLR
jgi:hypothetical protein